MNANNGHYGLYEEEEFDPLDDMNREQLFNDHFWSYSEPTIGDYAKIVNPPSLPELY